MNNKEYTAWKAKNGMVPSPQPRPKGWGYKRMMSNLKLKGGQ